jgi:hypothetical protein
MDQSAYPVQFSVDYPDRALNRVSTFFRIFAVIPIAIVLSAVSGSAPAEWNDSSVRLFGGGGLLFAAPMLMIVFRQKYPKWWFDWNLELQRFTTRVAVYLALMDDRYPSTDEQQSVHLDYAYPDVARDLNRWLPLVKWLLAIPHFIALFFLDLALIGVTIGAWFAILFTGRYPRSLFDFADAVLAWNNRVIGYAITLVTDQYPPFSLTVK